MIILLYLIVIFGWAILILIIKCRKAREKRIALAQQEEAQAQAAVHVIQIGNNFYDVIPITNSATGVTRCPHHQHSHCRRFRHSSSNNSLNHNSHSNPTFILDEGVYPTSAQLEPPPSYDEVIRLPNQFPKLNSNTVSPVIENPPPTIEEIEASAHSITNITPSMPAVISATSHSQQHQQQRTIHNNEINSISSSVT
ncbi:unnamed protein product [Diamesa tonsa]